jgi:purine-binding chemotaxis protein CheW
MDIAKIRKKLKEAEQKSRRQDIPDIEKSPSEESPQNSGEEKEKNLEKEPQKPTEEFGEKAGAEAEEKAGGTKEDEEEVEIQTEPACEEPPIVSAEPSKPEQPPESKFHKEGKEGPSLGTVKTDAELLAFKLASEFYAFKVEEIEEILKPQNMTFVPRVEPFIIGVTSLRGKIIPVIDLKKRLSLPENGKESGAEKVLILNGPNGSIGALVDMVVDVVRLPQGAIYTPPAHLTESELKFIEGVTVHDDMFISIIRMEEALNFKVFVETA